MRSTSPLRALLRSLLAAGFLPALLTGSAKGQLIDVTAPGNPVVGVAATVGSPTSTQSTVGTLAGVNNYPATETPANGIDNVGGSGTPIPPATHTKYLNFQETGTGLIVTPSALSVITGIRFATGNDAAERDPLTVTIEGTNSPNATTTLNSTWTLIYNGTSGLTVDPGRNLFGATAPFVNTTSFASYRLLVSSVRNGTTANSFQFSEVELLTAVPEPSTFALAGLGMIGLAARRWRRKPTPA